MMSTNEPFTVALHCKHRGGRERDRERQRERETERETERDRERQRERVRVRESADQKRL